MYSSILPGDATSMLMPYHSVHAPHHTQINKPSRASCNILVVLKLKLITMASQVWIVVNVLYALDKANALQMCVAQSVHHASAGVLPYALPSPSLATSIVDYGQFDGS